MTTERFQAERQKYKTKTATQSMQASQDADQILSYPILSGQISKASDCKLPKDDKLLSI